MNKSTGYTLIKKFILLTGLWFAVIPANAKDPLQNPFNITQFKANKENQALYGNYRKKWMRVTGFELSSLHWNQFVTVFLSNSPEIYRANYLEYLRESQDDYDDEDEDEDAPSKSNYTLYPVGTVIAKEGYTSHKGKPGAPTFLVLMKKHDKGYDDENGNWEYLQFAPDGQPLLRGSAKDPQVMAQCAGCHINVAERDYIFTTFFSGTIRY